MTIPSDCLVVEPNEGVSPFTHLTWNSHNCPKAIPLDIYELNKYRLTIVKDPHNLILKETIEPEKIQPEPEDKEVDLEKEVKDVTDALLDKDIVTAGKETKDLIEKVKAHGKGKNRKR